MPEKLKVELSASQPFVQPGQVNNFDIQADFLYGAPGSGLTVEADMRITVDAQPFPAFARTVSARKKSARSSSRR